MNTEHQDKYSDEGFFSTVTKYRNKLPFIHEALALFFCLKDPATPKWVKGTIIGALGYFIFPIDAVPDILIPVGFVDDAGVIAAAMATVSGFITDEHWSKADEWLYRH